MSTLPIPGIEPETTGSAAQDPNHWASHIDNNEQKKVSKEES